jgi:hypothetical protein
MEQLNLELFMCALPTKNKNHIYEEPLAMSCGHLICKRCLKESKDEIIKCYSCGTDNKNGLEDSKGVELAKQMIKIKIDNLAENVKIEFKNSLDSLKG